jgi:hypothetical protein
MNEAPPAFHLMAKPTGAVCNLDCAYCFFLTKERLYPGSRFRTQGYVEDLHEYLAHVPLHPLVEDPDEEIAVRSGRKFKHCHGRP